MFLLYPSNSNTCRHVLATDERLATKDVNTIRLLNTLYTASQWMEVLKMESVALKLDTQYSVQKPALAALICTILGETTS